jgi:hypothetical protein
MSPLTFATRTLYAPGHFGNSYESMGDNEFRARLTEWRDWGFNEYSDWFDPANCADPYVEPLYDLGRVLRDAKKRHFVIAQQLGMPGVLVLTPNTVFQEQIQPDLQATKTERIFGQLVCPSVPRGRDIILRNHENWFKDLAETGVKLRALAACPYDFGGCACDKCNPWILTFARLCREIHAIAERYHPDIEMRFVGWWWSAEEHRLFADWADAEAPGWVKSITQHIPYDQSDVADVPLPRGCERQAFVHISYAEGAAPRDFYGHLGPLIAADRIERTLHALKQRGCTGWMAYTEGVYDDVNKAMLAGLSAGRFATADDVLRDYVRRYLEADPAKTEAWIGWLRRWGFPYEADVARAAREYESLRAEPVPAGPAHWRLRQWESKLRMMQQHFAVLAAPEGSAARRTAAEAFWAENEKLNREVYGLGLQRHIFSRNFSPVQWQHTLEKERWTLTEA